MDTISRENNSILPIAGIIAGALALLLAIVALFKLSTASKEINTLKEDVNSRIPSIESQVSSAAAEAAAAKRSVDSLQRGTQDGFNVASNEIGTLKAELIKIQESLVKPKAAAGPAGAKTPKEPAVAGPDEYIVKSGDSGTKIAKATGHTVSDLTAVNPGINWNKLKVGDKLKLPKK